MAYPPLPLQTGLVGSETLPLLLMLTGLGLSLAEAIVPGVHLVVLGVALLAVGSTGLLIAPPAGPTILGLLVFILGAFVLYGYQEPDIYGRKGEGKTSGLDTLTGKVGRVTGRVTPTGSEVKLDEDGFNPCYAAWSVHDEPEAGAETIAVDPGSGNIMTIEGAGPGEDEIDRELTRERVRRHEEPAERDEEELEREGMEDV